MHRHSSTPLVYMQPLFYTATGTQELTPAAGKPLGHSSVQTVGSTCAARLASGSVEMTSQLGPCSQTDRASLPHKQFNNDLLLSSQAQKLM